MEPNAFVAEVYRRMELRRPSDKRTAPSFSDMQREPQVKLAIAQYRHLLPADLSAPILEIGFGQGWFIAACLTLGYKTVAGADFGIDHKKYVKDWAPSQISLHEIEHDIGDFLSSRANQYQFIHMSHVIEHIPKHSLLWVTDALYQSLKPGGTLCLRTPNMEGPTANSSYYVTLGHEYGFCGSNLTSLLDICGFEEIRLLDCEVYPKSLKQRIGSVVRWPFLIESRIRHRLFGVNEGGKFGPELVVTAKRGSATPLFDVKYR